MAIKLRDLFLQNKLVNLVLIVALFILILSTALSYKQTEEVLDSNKWVKHTYEVLHYANSTLLSLISGESNVTFYVLTGQKIYSQDQNANFNKSIQQIKKLKFLTVDNPATQTQIAQLEKIVIDKKNIATKITEIYNSGNKAQALLLATSPHRLQLKNQIDEIISHIVETELSLLEKRTINEKYQADLSDKMQILASTMSIMLFIISIIIFNYQSYLRKTAQDKQYEAENNLLSANKLLVENDERFRLATEGSKAGLWDWAPGANEVYYSPYFKKMLGYEENEFANTIEAFNEIIHPNDFQRLWDLVESHLKDNTPFNIEYRLKLKTGEYHWFQAVGQSTYDANGNPIRMSGSIADITERKRTELFLSLQYQITKILSEETKNQIALKKVMGVIGEYLNWDYGLAWIIDPKNNVLKFCTHWKQHWITDNSLEKKAMVTMFNFGVGMVGKAWESQKTLWTNDVTKEDYYILKQESIKAGLHSAICLPIILQNQVLGVLQFLSSNYKFDNAIEEMASSISSQIGLFLQRTKTESELRENEAYKTAVLEAASDSIVTIDESGIIVSYNPQTLKIFGFYAGELQKKSIDFLLPTILQQLPLLVEKEITEFIALHHNGNSFPVEISFSEMIVNHKKLFVLVIRDITERKKIEQMKNEFVSVVSHELRTPLTSIRGSLLLLTSGKLGDFNDKAKNLLNIASNNCERLLYIINDILDLEKLEAGKMKFDYSLTSIRKIIEETLQANKSYAEKFNVNLVAQANIPDLYIKVDFNRMLQIFANLISNAIKYSPPQGEVTLNVEKNRDKIIFSIIDNGQGIPKEFKDRLFQKFSQADSSDTRKKSGTGLGLSITKTIIEKMGGNLKYKENPNGGSIFYFDLPLVLSKSEEISNDINDENRLLICEDDEDQAIYLKSLLETAGFTVDTSLTVAQAQQFLSKYNYKALLLDLILPDQDGIAFIRNLRKNKSTCDLPIIVLSVIAQTGQAMMNGEAISVLDWLDKPVDFEKLLQAIKRIKKVTNFPTILHIEDDSDVLNAVNELLKNDAKVIQAMTIKEANHKLINQKYDLAIVDLVLPDGNASELLPGLARQKVPVIIFSAVTLDREYSKYVTQALTKSKTSTLSLISTIKNILTICKDI